LHADGDGVWLARGSQASAKFAEPRIYDEGAKDLVIATYGNGLYLSLRAARRLQRERGVRARILDLRFIVPLPIEPLLAHASEVGRLLIVDEGRRSGGVSEAIAAAVVDARSAFTVARVTGADSFIPLGDAANLVLLGEEEIYDAAIRLVES
jgi:2-oxoisovalerate dehydrogenase E1 component